jgi:dTDP-4-dehydrorhamnose reductase
MTHSRYLITGATGMLGHDLQGVLAGRDVTALGRAELDITDATAVAEAIDGVDVIINAAAYTKVDDAEEHEDEAHLVNAIGPETLARAAARSGAVLVQLSTDYVFDGRATTPYSEHAPLAPVSAYGRSKAEGEKRAVAAHPEATLIVRTAWLYGAHGPNFAATMLGLAGQRETLSVVDDQHGQPTWTHDLATQIVALLDSGARRGVFHGTSSGETTWFGFARAVFERAGLDPQRIQSTDSSAFVRPAPRPAYSVLGHESWRSVGLAPIRDWRSALDAAWQAGVFAPPVS